MLDHSRADIFERYYISQKVKRDVESVYLDCSAREFLIRAVSRMSLTRNLRVSKELTDEQKSMIDQDSHLVDLRLQKQILVDDMKWKYDSVSKIKRTHLHQQHSRIDRIVQNERQFLRRVWLKEIREKFFETIDIIEIERQLLRLSVSEKFKVEDIDKIHFTFDERARLAQNLFQSADSCAEDRSIQIISDWIALCSLQERSRRQRISHSEQITTKLELTDKCDLEKFLIICSVTQCIFCLENEQLRLNDRKFLFSRKNHLQRHMRDFHFRYLAADASFLCSHSACFEMMKDVMNFKNHTVSIHSIKLWQVFNKSLSTNWHAGQALLLSIFFCL